jgi:hypothetical protein
MAVIHNYARHVKCERGCGMRVTWIGLAQDSDDDSDLFNCKVCDAPIHLDVSCHKM